MAFTSEALGEHHDRTVFDSGSVDLDRWLRDHALHASAMNKGRLRRRHAHARQARLSIAEAAEALGVSDDLIYELTARGEPPCIRLGRRRVIPAVAIQAVIDRCLDGFRIGDRS